MKVFGIDFTSRPSRRKPLTCLSATLSGDALIAGDLEEWDTFDAFEDALHASGPWIAGIDFPFGQSRRFIENIGWAWEWSGYVDCVASLSREAWRETLEAYKRDRDPGDKEHRRRADVAAASISPQKLYGVPVALMFYEGAPRLRQSGVTIPGLQRGDADRIVVEAYPGVLARKLIGRRSYKHDTPAKQSPEQLAARRELLQSIIGGALLSEYGFTVRAAETLADDPTGDHLDALLCAVQAAWAWTQRHEDFGMPADVDLLEGWIADPAP